MRKAKEYQENNNKYLLLAIIRTFFLEIRCFFDRIFSAGWLAQMGEHLFDVQKVVGSIPASSTMVNIMPLLGKGFYFKKIADNNLLKWDGSKFLMFKDVIEGDTLYHLFFFDML